MSCGILVFLLIFDISSQILSALPINLVNNDTQDTESFVDKLRVDDVAVTSGKVTFEGPVRAKGRMNIFKNFGRGFNSLSCPRISAPSSFLPIIPLVALLPVVPIPISIYPIPQLKTVTKFKKVNKDMYVNEILNSENIIEKPIDVNNNRHNIDLYVKKVVDLITDYTSNTDKDFITKNTLLEQLSTVLNHPLMEPSSDEDAILTANFDPLLLTVLDPNANITVEPIALTAIVASDTNVFELPIEVESCGNTNVQSDSNNDSANSEFNLPIAGTVGFKGLLPASGSVKIFRTF